MRRVVEGDEKNGFIANILEAAHLKALGAKLRRVSDHGYRLRWLR